METVREQLVKRTKTTQDKVKQYGILAGTVVLAGIVLMLMQRLGVAFAFVTILIDIGILWGGWSLSGIFNVEYEYCIAGNELSVEKIIDQKRRKQLCSFNLKEAKGFYKYKKQLVDVTTISAEGDGEVYTIEFTDPKLGRTLLYFTPDERTLEMISPYLPRSL